VREFVRPHGIDAPATPLFCDAVDSVLRMAPPQPEPTPVRFVVLRWAMAPVFRLLRGIYGAELIRDDWSRKARQRRQLKEARLREREDRRRQKADLHQRRQQERAAESAARAAADRAKLDARAREEARKAELKRSKARAKAARERSRRRVEMRAQLKSRAVRLLSGWRSDGEGHAR
jgi:hypothetical protein